jgi:hypothetical protein
MTDPPPNAPSGQGPLSRFRRLSSVRPRLAVAITLIAAMIACGAGMSGAWIVSTYLRDGSPWRSNWSPGRVRDDDIALGLVFSGLAWLLFSIWLWRPSFRCHPPWLPTPRAKTCLRPIVRTVMIVVLATASVMAYLASPRWMFDDVEYIVTGACLLGSGLVVAVWLPVIALVTQGPDVADARGRINVRCPACGYSMIGLRSTTCPECGASPTIDELIRAQGYDALAGREP